MRIIFLLVSLIILLQPSLPAAEENEVFLKRSKALYFDAKPRQARIPALPPGQIRIRGVLNSEHDNGENASFPAELTDWNNGHYCWWLRSRFGLMGSGGDDGSLWFFADMDAQTGQITAVTVYGMGYCKNYVEVAFTLKKEFGNSFGHIGKKTFDIRASGPGISEVVIRSDPEMSSEKHTLDYAIIIQGNRDILLAKNGAKIPVKYYLAGEAFDEGWSGIDHGSDTAIVERRSPPDSSTIVRTETELVLPHEAMVKDAEKAAKAD